MRQCVIRMDDMKTTTDIPVSSSVPFISAIPTSVTLESLLNDIVRDAERFLRVFPNGCCLYTSGKVKETLGLEMVYGYFIKDGYGMEHYWNLDSGRSLLLDLTARQFDESLPRVLMIPVDSRYAEEHYVFL